MTAMTTSPKEIRRRLGLSQEAFWSRIGVTQSMGSRYERGWAIPKPVSTLLLLVHGKGIAPVNGRGEDPGAKQINARLDPREIRRKLGVTQVEFWSRIGMTQSAGSRYESGRAMPRTVQALLRLVQVERIELLGEIKNRLRAAPAPGSLHLESLNQGRTRPCMEPASPNRAIVPPSPSRPST